MRSHAGVDVAPWSSTALTTTVWNRWAWRLLLDGSESAENTNTRRLSVVDVHAVSLPPRAGGSTAKRK
jgi:hypothetical protein